MNDSKRKELEKKAAVILAKSNNDTDYDIFVFLKKLNRAFRNIIIGRYKERR